MSTAGGVASTATVIVSVWVTAELDASAAVSLTEYTPSGRTVPAVFLPSNAVVYTPADGLDAVYVRTVAPLASRISRVASAASVSS